MFSLDLKGLRFLGIGAKDSNKVLVVPLLYIVIRCVHPMDHTLDRVAFIADYESKSISRGSETILGY